MTYRGHIENGSVVFETASRPPEGAIVEVAIVVSEPQKTRQGESLTLGDKLLKYAGKAVGLPPDASEQHDHYLHGIPKR